MAEIWQWLVANLPAVCAVGGAFGFLGRICALLFRMNTSLTKIEINLGHVTRSHNGLAVKVRELEKSHASHDNDLAKINTHIQHLKPHPA